MKEEALPAEVETLPAVRDPKKVLQDAQKAAKELCKLVEKQKLYVEIQGRKYLKVEAWQTCGVFYGLTAVVLETKPTEYPAPDGWVARAEVRDRNGIVRSAAEAMCCQDEKNWKSKPAFQLRSMAQTRAISKALRNVLSWVVVLAGYEAPPAEEIESERVITEEEIERVMGEKASAEDIDTIYALLASDKVPEHWRKRAEGWIERGLSKVRAKALIKTLEAMVYGEEEKQEE